MPGVGHQHAGLHALGHGKHVAEQGLFDDQGGTGHPQRDQVDLRDRVGLLQLGHGGPQHAAADQQQ